MIRTNVHRRKINRYDIALHIPQIQNLLKLPTRTKIYELIPSHNGLNFTTIKFAGIQRSNTSYIPRSQVNEQILHDLDELCIW